MEVKRAEEILRSHEKIDVGFDGVQIWIDAIDEHNKTARIHTMDNPEDKKTVALAGLKEL